MSVLLLATFIFIFIAELGDKSQLLALVLASRYKLWQVLLGMGLAILSLNLIAAFFGNLAGSLFSPAFIKIIAALLFLGFGVWMLIEAYKDKDEEHDKAKAPPYGAVLAVFAAFFLAEFGDKTQLMTLTIAANPYSTLAGGLSRFGLEGLLAEAGAQFAAMSNGLRVFLVALASSAGMFLADSLAVLAGRLLGRALPVRAISAVSAIFFMLFGVLSLLSAFSGAS